MEKTSFAAGETPQRKLVGLLFPTNAIGLVRHYGDRYPVVMHELGESGEIDANVGSVELASESELRRHVVEAERLGKRVAISIAA